MKMTCKLLFILLLSGFAHTVKAQAIPKWKIADLQKAVTESTGATVINFWASFCKPCVAEIPYFQEEAKKYESVGVKLILVSLDMSETYSKIPAFAKKFRFDVKPVVFLDETNADLFCPVADPKWSGAIPATLFINNSTGYRQFYEDGVSREKFIKELERLVALPK
ncbi:MAG: hypothetical protein JWP69_712 [Flaviaesturariibacter sp.]|nr:hypothetical protein [Flaviaesturariibacter sp.]